MFQTFISSSYKRWANALIGVLLIQYAGGSSTFNYLIKPAVLGMITLFIIYKLPRKHLATKIQYHSTIYLWAFNCGITYLIVNVGAGFIQGFGKSPYSHTLTGILQNVFTVGFTLIGRESIRSYAVQSYRNKKQKLWLGVLILIMTVTNVSLYKVLNVGELKELTILMGEEILPELSHNILATYLVLYGGPLASCIYLGIIEAINWLAPILPNLNWLSKGMIGILVPMCCLAYISNQYGCLTKEIKPYRGEQGKTWQTMISAAIMVGFIWFMVGVFPIYPTAIATGSMKPLIQPGDVVLIEKVSDMQDIEALQVGEVIQFKRGDILIVHRIIEILEEEGVPCYRTKGDNNSVADLEIVQAQNVKGTLKGVIPKIGWGTLLFKGGNRVLDDIEF